MKIPHYKITLLINYDSIKKYISNIINNIKNMFESHSLNYLFYLKFLNQNKKPLVETFCILFEINSIELSPLTLTGFIFISLESKNINWLKADQFLKCHISPIDGIVINNLSKRAHIGIKTKI